MVWGYQSLRDLAVASANFLNLKKTFFKNFLEYQMRLEDCDIYWIFIVKELA